MVGRVTQAQVAPAVHSKTVNRRLPTINSRRRGGYVQILRRSCEFVGLRVLQQYFMLVCFVESFLFSLSTASYFFFAPSFFDFQVRN